MSSRLWRAAPFVAVATAGLGFWAHVVLNGIDSQKTSSPIVKGVMFHLRHNNRMAELLGQDIHIDKKVACKGQVNHFKGHADVEFKVVGSKGDAQVVYKGRRTEPDLWTSEIFDVIVKGSRISMRDE
ncbi:hypothetical protein HDU97_005959 [Phlyctochytrium planicorne]|nr:hypothetical protein HDU97_005959 [Phlyctochytrium planicorne]